MGRYHDITDRKAVERVCLKHPILKLESFTARREIIKNGAEFLHFLGRSFTLI